MAATPDDLDLPITSYALLGQLALRSWSVYEMTKHFGRTLHWFWPRAESALYAEIKRLATLGLVRARRRPGRRGRDATVYSITPQGRRELKRWLGAPSGGFSFQSEPLLRVHLAPYGTKDDLLHALATAREKTEELLRVGMVVATEFIEGRHQFQEQAHIRGILFDHLWRLAMAMHTWAEEWTEKVEAWKDIEPTARSVRDGVAVMRRALENMPDVRPAER